MDLCHYAISAPSSNVPDNPVYVRSHKRNRAGCYACSFLGSLCLPESWLHLLLQPGRLSKNRGFVVWRGHGRLYKKIQGLSSLARPGV